MLTIEKKQEIALILCNELELARTQVRRTYRDIMKAAEDPAKTQVLHTNRGIMKAIADPAQQSDLANSFLQNSLQYLIELMELGAKPNGAYSSSCSIILDLLFQNCTNLEMFMSEYRNGKVAEITQNVMATEQILSILNLQSLKLTVKVSDEDFERYRSRLQNFKSQRNTKAKVMFIRVTINNCKTLQCGNKF